MRLKLYYGQLLSIFAFKSTLRRSTPASSRGRGIRMMRRPSDVKPEKAGGFLTTSTRPTFNPNPFLLFRAFV